MRHDGSTTATVCESSAYKVGEARPRIATAAASLLLLLLLAAPLLAQWERDANGWTVFQSSPDTRKVYVSSSQGDDDNSGLSPDDPVATVRRGRSLMRDHYPDWLLMKRGDTWSDQSLGKWRKRGRSAEEPMRIAAYGTGARPLLETGTRSGLSMRANFDGPQGNLAITDLHLKGRDLSGPDPAAQTPHGIDWHAPGQNLLLENVRIENYSTNAIIRTPQDTGGFSNLQVRRSVITDSFAKHRDYDEGTHSQGLYTARVDGILIEGNVFDHNGWNPAFEGAVPTVYNHNIYLQNNNSPDVVVRDNIIARASAHGLQARTGGVVEGNVFISNAIGFYMRLGRAFDNLVLHASDRRHRDGYYRAVGIDMKNTEGSEVFRNIIAQTPENGRKPLTGIEGVDAHTNIIFNWGDYEDVGPFLDPERTIASYDEMIGGSGSIASFLEAARMLSRRNWRPEYTAEAVRDYFPYFLGAFDSGERTLEPGDLTLEPGGISSVPEPASLILMLTAGGATLLGRPRRRSARHRSRAPSDEPG